MNIEEIKEKAIAHVEKMLTGKDKGGEKWNGDAPMYEGFCGWCGPMAPLNRPAFVQKFGEELTALIERAAAGKIANRAMWWQNSKARGYEEHATANEGVDPSSFKVGDFVWGIMDGMKCDHEDLSRIFRDFIYDEKDGEKLPDPRLCRIIRIEEVDDIERDAETILKGWKSQENEGGSASDDLTDEDMKWSNYSNLTDEQKRTVYTLAVLIRDKHGKWFMVDPEGYSYPRYVILPKGWKEMYPLTIAQVTAKEEARRKAIDEALAAEKAKARAAYDARCAKWEGIMEPVPAGLDEYDTEWRKIGKRNVLKMARAAFPWVRFSVSAERGWGHGYVLSWKNGPTVDEVKAVTDFGLFEPWCDTFDGMTDCSGISSAVFTDFSDKFGGIGNGVDFNREEAETDRNGSPDDPPKAPKPKAEKTAATAPVDGITITENTAKNGIEIRFPAKPSDTILTSLKANGWRWTRFNGGCWYHRDTPEARETAEKVRFMWNEERIKAA